MVFCLLVIVIQHCFIRKVVLGEQPGITFIMINQSHMLPNVGEMIYLRLMFNVTEELFTLNMSEYKHLNKHYQSIVNHLIMKY